jgi:uncharacterized protein (DUF4415 family)
MKKTKQIHKAAKRLTPKQTLEFLDSFARLVTKQDKPTRAISLRIPANILEAFKAKTKSQDLKYQSQIVKLMRDWLSG